MPDGARLIDTLRAARATGRIPDLVVSDVRMPGQTGLDVVRTLRSWGWTTPVILITAFGDESTKCEAQSAGATVLFSKPFDLDDLRTAVQHFLPGARHG